MCSIAKITWISDTVCVMLVDDIYYHRINTHLHNTNYNTCVLFIALIVYHSIKVKRSMENDLIFTNAQAC